LNKNILDKSFLKLLPNSAFYRISWFLYGNDELKIFLTAMDETVPTTDANHEEKRWVLKYV
jgi:hypothetical protein